MFHDLIRMRRPFMNRGRKRIREAGNRAKMDDMAIVQLGLTKEEFDKNS
jgi:hypothetical protein